MTSVGWATLDVIPSVKGLARELDRQTSGDLATAGKRGGKRFGDAAGKEAATGFKARFQNGVRDLNPLGGIAVGAGIALGFKDIYQRASDAEQSIGGVQSVFKQYADSVVRDSERAEQALGLSATAYQELVTVTGALLKNKGIEDFAGQAKELLEIGADLAATYGGSTKEAVEALNAAMRGESDPIERYAISLNETAVNARLAEQGLSGLKGTALDQAKAQARVQIILDQSADAAGAFARESDTAAGASARASAQFENMRTELGEKLLPAATSFIGFLNDDALPALSSAGGFAADMVREFRALPPPVQAAAAAFGAFRLASATGLTDGVASGVSRTSSAIETLRLRTMLAADEYRSARTITRTFGDTSVRVSSNVGRLNATMSALRTGAQGAGSALSRGLRGAVGLLGGPWGIALAGGAALVTKFYNEQQKAKARVEDLTSSLDSQTGAITDLSRETAYKALLDSGAVDDARKLGIGLDTLTNAYLGNKGATAELNREFEAFMGGYETLANGGQVATALDEDRSSWLSLRDAISLGNEETRKAQQAAKDHAEAMGQSEDAQKAYTGEIRTYASEIDNVRNKLQKLIDKEKERALNAIQNRRDNIALLETFKAAREEAEDGRRTLNANTEAGRENMSALLDLADQWANTNPKVANAEGAYEKMRRKFVDVAEQMGATKGEARKLADELLKVPKTAPLKFQSEGYRERMQEIADIKAAIADIGSASVDFTPRGFGRPDGGTGPLSSPRTPKPSPGKAGVDPRAQVVNNNTFNVTGSDWPEIKKDSQRAAQRRGLGGY